MGASRLAQPHPEGSPPVSGRDEARQEDGGLGAPSSQLPPPAAPPGPRSLQEWRRRKVADLNARFPGWHVWRDDAAGTYRAIRRGNHLIGPGAPPEALADPDVHLLGVHLAVLSEERP